MVSDFSKVGINLVFYKDAGIPIQNMKADENAETLIENAYEKASMIAKKTHMMTLGDDSGIFIEELDYFPGVHSRRWSGIDSDDHGRNQRILELMKNEKKNRAAFLISRFSLCDSNGNEIFRTAVKNTFFIAYTERGEHGFGYDNILIPSSDKVQDAVDEGRLELKDEERRLDMVLGKFTIGEMNQIEKNAINNRGKIA